MQAMHQKSNELKMRVMELFASQTYTLDKYISKLAKSQRFKNVKGPLYDPNTGWNPGYRVMANDLRSIIPLKPFEALHKTPDVYFGQPADAEVDSIGYMPFTWMQDGVKLTVHPINYELARAKGIREIYSRIARDMDTKRTFWTNRLFTPEELLKDYGEYWTEWNKALVSHKIGGYENENDVLFKDKFVKFLKKLRSGQIQGKDNNLETATKKKGIDWGTVATVGLALGSPVGLAIVGIGMAGKALFNAGKKAVKNVSRILNYDKGDPNLEYKDGDSWLERRKKDTKRAWRKAQAAEAIYELRDEEVGGVKYGGVRDFWLDSGALDLFANNTIMGTVGATTPLIDFLIKKGMFPEAPKADKANRIHDLMHWFFEKAGIKGYSWKQVMVDEPSQAGFAQVFLEYLKYKVLPQWNKVEKLLSNDITYKTKATHEKLLKGIHLINFMMSENGIFAFMNKHLRFPNMAIKLIDYSNAKGEERKKLDGYRKAMGIPDQA